MQNQGFNAKSCLERDLEVGRLLRVYMRIEWSITSVMVRTGDYRPPKKRTKRRYQGSSQQAGAWTQKDHGPLGSGYVWAG